MSIKQQAAHISAITRNSILRTDAIIVNENFLKREKQVVEPFWPAPLEKEET